MQRKSWDTAIKHLTRTGIIHDILSPEQIKSIPKSNLTRWKNESENKYQYCDINQIIHQEIELIKKINQSSKIKNLNKAYFYLADTFHQVIGSIKGIKTIINHHKQTIVDTIEKVKNTVCINDALQIFNLSRGSYENYKSIVIHKCDQSYFKWCTKRFVNQLLPSEVNTIKKYLNHQQYKHWSKASIYLKAVRDQNLSCSLSTFYKYCRLLGYKNRPRYKKSDHYRPLISTKPNQTWCADVTIFKTEDHQKHYIHFLIDHFSKYIIGYSIAHKTSPIIIKNLLKKANKNHKPDHIEFLTDGGTENVNHTVSSFINDNEIPIQHLIAQKDVIYSNSMIESVNKVIKHQFLFPKTIKNKNNLEQLLTESVSTYNTIRPQFSLGGNTPEETFNGTVIQFSKYSQKFKEQIQIRRKHHQNNQCGRCE